MTRLAGSARAMGLVGALLLGLGLLHATALGLPGGRDTPFAKPSGAGLAVTQQSRVTGLFLQTRFTIGNTELGTAHSGQGGRIASVTLTVPDLPAGEQPSPPPTAPATQPPPRSP